MDPKFKFTTSPAQDFSSATNLSLHIQYPLSALPQLALRPHITVERRPSNTQLSAEFADTGLPLTHGCLCQTDLRFRKGELPPSFSSPCAGGLQPRFGALPDEFPFEFGQGGEDAEDELATSRGGVDVCPLSGENPETDPPIRKILYRVDEMTEVPAESAQQHQPRPCEIGPNATIKPKPGELTDTGRAWTFDGIRGDEAILHRDWTEAERSAWGEIKDAGYRFVRGMMEASHDLSMAKFFRAVRHGTDEKGAWTRDFGPKATEIVRKDGHDWVRVPKGKVNTRSPLTRYGDLTGRHVRKDVWRSIKRYGRPILGESRAARVYTAMLNRWKLWKTVYNPVTHFNNTLSNFEMLYTAGYTWGDFARGWRALHDKEANPFFIEARDHGLYGADWASSLVDTTGRSKQNLDGLLEDMLQQADDDVDLVDSVDMMMRLKEWWLSSRNAVTDALGAWNTGLEAVRAKGRPILKGLKSAKRPVDFVAHRAQRLYRWEDEVFKTAVFVAQRKRGASIDQAIEHAERYFFDYRDLPDPIKFVREFPIGNPFISYTFKAVPAIAENIVRHPERVAALVAGIEAINYAGLVLDGMEPSEYYATIEAEDTILPAWMKGRSMFGALNNIHLPGMDGYLLALGRSHMGGNPFVSESQRDVLPALPYLSDALGPSPFGSNPFVAPILDAWVNEDWRGKRIYHPGDPDGEGGDPIDVKQRKVMNYLYQAWSPSNLLTPGSYHQQKLIEGFANDDNPIAAGIVDGANFVSEALGGGQFTGRDRADNPIESRDAALAAFGIKLRPARYGLSFDFMMQDLQKKERDIQAAMRPVARDYAEDRITEAQFMDRYDKMLKQLDKVHADKEKAIMAFDRLQQLSEAE